MRKVKQGRKTGMLKFSGRRRGTHLSRVAKKSFIDFWV